MRMRGAIFDMDGTLLDSTFVWSNLGEAYLRHLGCEPRENLADVFRDMSLMQAARYYQREYGVTLSVDEIMTGVNAMLERFYQSEAQLKPGARELLELLQKKDVRMCLATATDRRLAEAALERCGVLAFFERVLTCDEVGAGKDEPRIFHLALRFLGTRREETFVFEDALYAVRTAKSAGFPVVAVRDPCEGAQDRLRRMATVHLEHLTQTDRLRPFLPE